MPCHDLTILGRYLVTILRDLQRQQQPAEREILPRAASRLPLGQVRGAQRPRDHRHDTEDRQRWRIFPLCKTAPLFARHSQDGESCKLQDYSLINLHTESKNNKFEINYNLVAIWLTCLCVLPELNWPFEASPSHTEPSPSPIYKL